jgi:uncharacterized protein YgfB (UPF0149 family)
MSTDFDHGELAKTLETPTQRARLSSDASGILHDLGVIAASHFDYADNTEDEQALADVIDFVRTGCAFLRHEISAAARAPARALH